MPEQKNCHSKLLIPSNAQSSAAISSFTRVFNQILANWASDLLAIQQERRLSVQFSTQCTVSKHAA